MIKIFIVSALALAAFGQESDKDLLKYSPEYTGTAYENALKSNWVSVYYKVNQNIDSAKRQANADEYSSATWLYGTTQLPPVYDASWGKGYQARAKQVYERTATAERTSSDTEIDNDSDTESGSDSDSDSDASSSTSSSASKAAYSSSAVALGALGAMVAVAASFM
ncbi:hypothetical protein LPJ56_000760 [Coemansia sp. RSA 2599]|nr:hypothetical protein LPJ75_000246 [Coemansia sp. RSA 2598]KAJ1828938.1 hypothetical protein LPJ56_000760 [Coemansia sp. RSA 2599]